MGQINNKLLFYFLNWLKFGDGKHLSSGDKDNITNWSQNYC